MQNPVHETLYIKKVTVVQQLRRDNKLKSSYMGVQPSPGPGGAGGGGGGGAGARGGRAPARAGGGGGRWHTHVTALELVVSP